jgi:hypothetical protein
MKPITVWTGVLAIALGVEFVAPGNISCAAEVPAWPGEYAALNVLNNVVTELLRVASVDTPGGNYAFSNPRDGWVFFSVAGKKDGIAATLDDRADPLVWRSNPETGALEAMQFLAEGKHRIRVSRADGARLDVRAVPEIAFCYYPATPHIGAYGVYDWAYVEHHVLPHVNVLITRDKVNPAEFDQWLREGRRWIANSGLPGLGSPKAPSADDVYAVWSSNPGAAQPGFAGMIVDEFFDTGADYYLAWSEALERLYADPGFARRTFYAWCGDLFRHEPSRAFSRLLLELNGRVSWEKYLHEAPTEAKARERIDRDLRREVAAWKSAMPGIERRLVMCLGYLSAPPETLNLNPAVDYHVFMDMQFHALATEPTFFGLYGIMEYMSNYADEESLRYAHKLFRHYCIEGKRKRFNTDPYLLPHLSNPDFADGLQGWQVDPAEKGSIDAKSMKGFSWLQGRYPETTDGDRFCSMRRSAQRPNRVAQAIKALKPGRLYSLKLLSADFQQLDKEQKLALAIDLPDAEILKEHGVQFVYPSCYSHEVKPYTREHPAYFNFHRVVFRPSRKTILLTISDWSGPNTPGGPIGQETMFNFVEVQPFHES